jgi:hypothetical protein
MKSAVSSSSLQDRTIRESIFSQLRRSACSYNMRQGAACHHLLPANDFPRTQERNRGMFEVLPSEGLPSLESSRDNDNYVHVHTCHGVEQAQFDRVRIVSMVTTYSICSASTHSYLT